MSTEMVRATIKSADATYEGILIQEKEGLYVLKLDSGYNIGIDKKNVKSIKKGATVKTVKLPVKKYSSGKKPRVSILLTGGTVASKVDYVTGAVVAQFTPESIGELFPEAAEMAEIDIKFIGNHMSENFRFSTYNLIGKAIHAELKKKPHGIIIAMGTDTLHYASAAINFMFPNVGTPILFVASQRSSDRPSSDAALNLLSAVRLITKSDFGGVGVVMHETLDDNSCLLLRATNCRKMHTSRRDAFRPVNQSAWASIKSDGSVDWIAKIYPKRAETKEEKLKLFKEDLKIGLIKAYPNMHAAMLAPFTKYDGLVIEGLGIGHLTLSDYPENEEIAKAIASLAKKIPVALAPQTIYGRIDMDVYSEGRKAKTLGILGNQCDMTPEVAYIKLAWLLSTEPKRVKELYSKNLVGEISEYSTVQGYHEF
ncbi:MAG: Glu-tRNA(Gln) amidotransferase subunit GatD [Candidatus Woesearchaeota archaeon]